MLAVFPADFDALAAAVVWEMEADPAKDALSELVKWSLVEFTVSPPGRGRGFQG
jgi:hypothetical protein